MKRRDFLKSTLAGAVAMTAGGIAFAKEYFPTQVDENLFKGINRAEEGKTSELPEKHAPVIKAPEKVNAGEVFPVEVRIGKTLHPMGSQHWIENIKIAIGNEPAGMLTFQPQGYLKPEGKFNLALDEKLKGKTVSLVVQAHCNLHGIWESYVNVEVA